MNATEMSEDETETMSNTADLVIRRAKALLETMDERCADYTRRKAEGERVYGSEPTVNDFSAELGAIRDAISRHDGTTEHTPIPFKSEIIESIGSETRETHESFGLLSFSRTQGGYGRKHLFGSHVEDHPTTIMLRVTRGDRCFSNDLSYDRYHPGEDVLEAEMSAAQFADAITLMNQGVGIPCTLKYVNGVVMEPVPSDHRSEQHMIVENFAAKMGDVREGAAPQVEALAAILSKKSIGKKDRKEITWLFEQLIRGMSDNAAFTMSQFNEATSKLETAAKREVEAYANSVIVSAGLESLQAQAQARMADEIEVTPTLVIDGPST